MQLSETWYSLLKKSNVRIKLLVTIGAGKLSEITGTSHPGTWGKVIRASTHCDTHPQLNGQTYPYWPTVMEWPPFGFRYSPEERAVDSSSITIRLSPLAGYADLFLDSSENTQTWMQIDAWTDGVPLDEAIMLMSGPISRVSRSTPDGVVTLFAEDKFDGFKPHFPPNETTLSKFEFSEVPDEFEGRAPRIFILNSLPELIPITPISNDGLEYYIAEPFMTPPPNEFFVGSDKITNQVPKVVKAYTDYSGDPYTKLVLQRRPQAAGSSGQLFARGGSGPNTENPISFFLDRVVNLKKTRRASLLIDDLNRSGRFDYYVVVSNDGDVIDLVTERLLPQSNLIPFFRGGKLDMIRENDQNVTHILELGSVLQYRIGAPELTEEDNVYNAIDVRFSRKNVDVTKEGYYSRDAEMIDKNFGGTIGTLLSKSERIYGRKPLVVDAADLHVREDARRLGVGLAKILHSVHRKYTYHVAWKDALRMDINDRALITDDNFVLLKTRIGKMDFGPTGVDITFQTEDL